MRHVLAKREYFFFYKANGDVRQMEAKRKELVKSPIKRRDTIIRYSPCKDSGGKRAGCYLHTPQTASAF